MIDIDEKFIIRHAIIKHLYSKVTYDKYDRPNLFTTLTTLEELAEKTGYTYKEILISHHGIPDTQAKCIIKNEKHCMYLQRDGIDAAIENYWLKEGGKKHNDEIHNLTQWVFPYAALIVSIVALVITCNKPDTELKDLDKRIQQIEFSNGNRHDTTTHQ